MPHFTLSTFLKLDVLVSHRHHFSLRPLVRIYSRDTTSASCRTVPSRSRTCLHVLGFPGTHPLVLSRSHYMSPCLGFSRHKSASTVDVHPLVRICYRDTTSAYVANMERVVVACCCCCCCAAEDRCLAWKKTAVSATNKM